MHSASRSDRRIVRRISPKEEEAELQFFDPNEARGKENGNLFLRDERGKRGKRGVWRNSQVRSIKKYAAAVWTLQGADGHRRNLSCTERTHLPSLLLSTPQLSYLGIFARAFSNTRRRLVDSAV